jgi:hypothetical protein
MFEGMSIVEILKLLAPLIIIQVCLEVFCIYRLIKDRVKLLPKWAWALIILIFSTIGSAVFLLIGRERD